MPAAALEIERKFLVAAPPPDLGGAPSGAIRQGYLAIGDDGTEVRVRDQDGDVTLTVKQGGGRTRVEEAIALDAEAFDRLWPLTAGQRIEKTRHVLVREAGCPIEVDVYQGALAGLVVAEVEFASEEEAEAFAPPAWLGAEVTEDSRYKNQRLAREGVPGD